MAALALEINRPAASPAATQEKDALRFTTAGSVDDGKSTLIGRLLHDARCVHEDHLDALRASGVNRSTGPLDFSLLTDGLKAEREQGITIDVAYRHFATPRRRFLIADTPGHEQYTRNMATGASTADAAIILVDARHGLTRQSRRHAYIAWLLGIRHLLIAVNKMDLVRFEPDAFERVRGAWDELAGKLPGASLHLLPISALDGDNVVTRSHRMPWYGGPSLLELLETIDAPAWNTGAPLRFPVQYVIRPNLDFRGYAGRIDSGTIRVGEYVTVQPSGKRSRVERIVTFDGDLEEAFAPMAVTLVLEDELDVGRGDWICAQDSRPSVSSRLDATLVWMHEKPLQPGAAVLLQQGATRVPARVQEILHRTDPETFEDQPARQLALNEIGLVRLETAHTLALDRYRDNRHTGSFVLIDRMENFTLGAGMVERMAAPELQSRCEAQVVIVRSEMLLVALERALFARGRAVAVFPRVPALAQLRDLAAHGLIALAQTPPADRDEAGLIEIAQTGTIRQSVDAALRELERRGLLPKEEN